MNMNTVCVVPDELESSNAKLIYFYISKTGSSTINEISAALNLKKITLLSVIKTLQEKNLIQRNKDTLSIPSKPTTNPSVSVAD